MNETKNGGEGEFKVTVERNLGGTAGPSFVPHCAVPGCPACAAQPAQPQHFSPQPAPMHNHPPPPVIPIPVPMPAPTAPAPAVAPKAAKKKTWHGVDKPHPLLWLTLAISILAVVLGVPKGALPTITGRHRALRAQELLVQERLALLTQLSGFLPPPLASLFAIPDAALVGGSPAQLDVLRLGAGLQLWHSQGRRASPWWTLEELGGGATVVHSLTPERDREVWVLRTGDDNGVHDHALLAALTNSLLARERLHAELEEARKPCPPCPAITLAAPDSTGAAASASDDKWSHLEERSRALRDRAADLDDREHDVARREMWVVDAMRKLSDKSHAAATELALEDRVVERLKSYQRQVKEQS